MHQPNQTNTYFNPAPKLLPNYYVSMVFQDTWQYDNHFDETHTLYKSDEQFISCGFYYKTFSLNGKDALLGLEAHCLTAVQQISTHVVLTE